MSQLTYHHCPGDPDKWIPRDQLVNNTWYIGDSRNAGVAIWFHGQFHHYSGQYNEWYQLDCPECGERGDDVFFPLEVAPRESVETLNNKFAWYCKITGWPPSGQREDEPPYSIKQQVSRTIEERSTEIIRQHGHSLAAATMIAYDQLACDLFAECNRLREIIKTLNQK